MAKWKAATRDLQTAVKMAAYLDPSWAAKKVRYLAGWMAPHLVAVLADSKVDSRARPKAARWVDHLAVQKAA